MKERLNKLIKWVGGLLSEAPINSAENAPDSRIDINPLNPQNHIVTESELVFNNSPIIISSPPSQKVLGLINGNSPNIDGKNTPAIVPVDVFSTNRDSYPTEVRLKIGNESKATFVKADLVREDSVREEFANNPQIAEPAIRSQQSVASPLPNSSEFQAPFASVGSGASPIQTAQSPNAEQPNSNCNPTSWGCFGSIVAKIFGSTR